MKLITPTIFEPFGKVVAGVSMSDQNLGANGDMSDRHNPKAARTNRELFATELGFSSDKLAIPHQEHSAIVHIIREEYYPHSGDGIVTNEPGWLLGVTVADCVPLLLFDPQTKSYGIVHSGWRGSAQNITGIALTKLMREYGARPEHIHAWVGPSAAQASYSVQADVFEQFNPRYSKAIDTDSWLFDNKQVVYDQLLDCGLSEDHIEVSGLDTVTNHNLHSERRDGDNSGRMLAAIGLSD